MRLEATIAPTKTQATASTTLTPNLSVVDVQVITITELGASGFDQICINGQNHGQIIVALGQTLFTIKVTPDGKGIEVSGLKGRLSPTKCGHSALKAECKLQPVRTITKEDSSMVIVMPDSDKSK